MGKDNGIFYTDLDNIKSDIIDMREEGKIKLILNNLYMYSNNVELLTKQYTEILNDDNIVHMVTRISQDTIFKSHFPEFYQKNEYGENVINCQQNSKYHKYGVFKHILYTVELVSNAQIQIGDWQRMLIKWTMFLHDIGKPYVKVIKEDGTDSFAGHDDMSYELAKNILERFHFSSEEKKIILTLIKYHDKFLNEGELTFDNLRFLAQELEDKKDLFYLLIYVKDADAQAKCLEVYNNHKLIRAKYLDFANSFFEHSDITNKVSADEVNRLNNIKTGSNDIATKELNGKKSGEEDIITAQNDNYIDKEFLDRLTEDILNKRRIGLLYQPIIDMEQRCVYGYETYSVIEGIKNLNIAKFLRYAQDNNKYDKIQQSLFINALENFSKVKSKEGEIVFSNIDLGSYESYINKPRLYDIMGNMKIAMELHNYEKYDLSTIQQKIMAIQQRRAQIVLDHFGIGIMTIDDLKILSPDYVKPDISLVQGIEKDESKQKYISELLTFCIAKEIKLLVVGIETKEQLDAIRKLGVRYVQGYYFSYPTFTIEPINEKINKLLNSEENDSII
ncbi:MAG: EAL domain-containing protein [Clostridia bacterium]|nr:EAL domain-containing protein [Clostridia bacterium]